MQTDSTRHFGAMHCTAAQATLWGVRRGTTSVWLPVLAAFCVVGAWGFDALMGRWRIVRAAIDDHPDQPDPHLSMAFLLESQGRLAEAIEHAQQAVSLAPDHPSAHYQLGNLLLKKERFNEAAHAYREALRVTPADDRIHHSLGVLYFRRSQFHAAANHLSCALRLNLNLSEVADLLRQAVAAGGSER